MDATGVGICLALVAIVAGLIGWWIWQRKQVQATETWPATEATVESGGLEVVAASTRARVELPTFAFSYAVAGEYDSGRFSLMPSITDPPPNITSTLVGRKLPVRYNPAHPEIWYLPDELIEGCKVEQKMGPHLIGFYPQD